MEATTMDLSTLRSRENVTRLEYPVTVGPVTWDAWADVDLAGVTPGFMGRVMGYNPGSAERDPFSILAALAEVVVAWDLERDGAPLPVSPEAMAEVPTPYVEALSTAVARAAGVDPQKREPSADGSRQKG